MSDTVEIEGINIPIVVNANEVSAGFGKVREELAQMNGEAAKVGAGVTKIGTDITTTSAKVKDSGTKMEGSFKSLAVGMSQTMTSAFSLYQSFDNIEKKQYALEKANLAAQRSTEAVDQAQKDYNKAVEKFGVDSVEAKDALDKLNLSKAAAELADERVKMSQNNLNDSMVMAGLTVIPAVISGIDGMGKMWKNLQGMNIGGAGGMLEKIKGGLQGLGSDKIGVLGSAVTGVGALFTAFMAFNAKTPEMKAAYSILTGALVTLTLAQWASNIAAATGLSMTIVGAALVLAGVAAGAAMYVMSQQYGPKEEPPPELGNIPTGVGGGAAGGAGGIAGAAGPYTGTGMTGGPVVTPWGAASQFGPYTLREEVIAKRLEEARSYPESETAGTWFYDDAVFKQIGENAWMGRHGFVYTYPEVLLLHQVTNIEGIASLPYVNWAADWLDMMDETTGTMKLMHLKAPYYRFYEESGWALTPHIGVVAEKGPELMLTEPRLDDLAKRLGGGGGNVYIFNIDGSRDVDLIMNEIAKRMRESGGTFT